MNGSLSLWNGEAICAVVTDQGGPDQGFQQLDVFSDYRNGNHGIGAFIETNVFQEQVIGAGDIGSTWLFEFDAKRGNIGGGTTAVAFFKTIHPTQFWLSRFITIDMTSVPDTWGGYSLSITIDPDLEGHLLQFGFLNTATYYEGSGIYYDNVVFRRAPLGIDIDIHPDSYPNSINPRSRGVVPVAILGSATFDVTAVDVTTLSFGPAGASPFHRLNDPFTYNDHLRDVNFDGYLDLVTHYRTQNTGIACGDESATLTGATLDDVPIEGSDSLSTVGCRASGRATWADDVRVRQPGRHGSLTIERN